jgi:hypothetical protein
MLKKNYYCLVAGLPDLILNEKRSDINLLSFREELKEQLIPIDFNLAKQIYFEFDNENLLSLLYKTGKPFNKLGNISADEMEEQIVLRNSLPGYMVEYLKWYDMLESKEYELHKENKLHQMFHEHILKMNNSYLSNWFTFQLNLKNIFVAFNCSRFNYEVTTQLITTGSNITLYRLLVNNRLKREFFEEEIPFAKRIFGIAESNASLIDKEKALDRIKWDFLDEETFFYYFTIERILSFLIKLNLAQRWLKLNADIGRELLQKLVADLKTRIEFPEEYSSNK